MSPMPVTGHGRTMANDTNPRAYRHDSYGRDPRDTYGRDDAADPAGASDPLAELARLIGQEDPFADLGRQAGTGRGAADGRREFDDRDAGYDPVEAPPAPEWLTRGNYAAAPQQPYPEQPNYVQQPAYQDDPRYADPRYADPPYQESGTGYADPQDGYADPAYQQTYRTGSAAEAGYAEGNYAPDAYSDGAYEGYYEDGQGAYGEEQYDQPAPQQQQRRRGGLMTVAAVLGLAVVGTVGAFAYRSMSSDADGPPPVIKADATPSKVVPAAPAEPQQNKLIYDRVGEAPQGERLVSREEEPLDVKNPPPGPRVVFPPLAATTGNPASPPPAATAAGSEPKRVRTVTIRPDEPDAGAPMAAPAPQAPMPQAQAPQQAAAAPVPEPEPAPSRGGSVGTAPLAIGPQQPAPPAAAPTRSAPFQTAAATSATAPARATSGGYVVQVTAQKSEAEAQASFRALQAKYPSVLGGRQPLIRRADLGERGVYYRAQVGPFSANEANELCGNLKAAGGQCIVQRN